MIKFDYRYNDKDGNKVIDAFCEDFNYQDKVQVEVDGVMTEQDNPESRQDFTDRIIEEYIERQTFVNNEKKDNAEAIRVRNKTMKVKRNKGE